MNFEQLSGYLFIYCMATSITINKPFLNLKDSDLQVMFGILISDADSSSKKRYKLNKLREKIEKTGIQLMTLGEEEGILMDELYSHIKRIENSNYTPKGKHVVS